MKLTAVFEPAPEGGYTCWVEEIPAAISEGETLEEAQANLMEAAQLVLECQRELSEQSRSSRSVKQTFELAAA
jgi:predicted RNase H-like HicB family nuclease